MDSESTFCDVKLNKTEMTVLCSIQNDPERCIHQRIRALAEQCYSDLSSPVRLAKKLKFSDWLELIYFIKSSITMPELSVTSDIDYMGVQPGEVPVLLLVSLKQQRILIHGNGSSQLIAQYIYNKFLVTDVNVNLAPWSDYGILEQKSTVCFDSIWIISKSGRSNSVPSWAKALKGKEINLVYFIGDYRGPPVQTADTAFTIHDPQKFDDDVYWSSPLFGYCVLGFERLLKIWFTDLRSNS